MLITFKSPASSDVIMFEKNAREILQVLGKDPEAPKGVVTTEQLPKAMHRLKAAIAADTEQRSERAVLDDESEEDADIEVRFSQRAFPVVKLLDRSMAEDVPVTWGV
jgi:GTP cyclohydrolase I